MDDDKALAGLRVFELSVAVAAPCAGRYLAFHGADVIKVESRVNPDVARMFGSAWARTEDLAPVFFDTSPYLPEMTAGKRSIGLELKDEGALAAAHQLIAGCDVFLSNFTAEALDRMGMGYDQLRVIKPDLVYVMMPGFGADPALPYFPFRAFGPNQAPLVGLDALTGYPGQEPAGIASVAPPDYVAGMHAVVSILSALEEREQSGEGSKVVISQMETTVSLLGPYLVDHALTSRSPGPSGSRISWAAPTGVYPCAGHDRHVALSVDGEEAWAGLVSLVGDRLTDPGWGTLEGRVAAHDQIDEAITTWTVTISPAEAAARLQGAGIAAYEVLDHRGVLADPQVRDRAFYQVAPSTRFGRDLFTGHPIRLSETPVGVPWAGPNMGQHTRQVLHDVGLSEAEIDALVERGAAFEERSPEVQLRRPFDQWYELIGLIGNGEER
jgi:benzylsuccinate CoA-transferase BbsF subunit